MKSYRNPFYYIVCVVPILLAISLSAAEESRGLYVFGNLSIFNEDAEVRHGSGLGFGAGAGYQFNKFFALEFSWDAAPSIEPAELNQYLQSRPIVPSTRRYFDVEAEGNKYVSFHGTLTLSANKQISIMSKVGVVRRWRLETVHFLVVTTSIGQPTTDLIRTEIDEQRYAPVMQVGLRLKLPKFEKVSIDLTMTQFFGDDIKSSFFGTSVKFPFPKG